MNFNAPINKDIRKFPKKKSHYNVICKCKFIKAAVTQGNAQHTTDSGNNKVL